MAVVYTHTRLDTEELFYVGIGKTEKRAYSKHSRNKHWIHITNKTQYRVAIVETGLSWEEACIKERELIKKYGRKVEGGLLTNLTEGGDGNTSPRTQETRKKISDSGKGKRSSKKGKTYKDWYSEEEEKLKKQQISLRTSGAGNSMYGKVRSQETKDKIRAKLKGKKVSEEQALSNRTVCLGRKYISKDGVKKKVRPEELNKYLEQGWKLGQKH